MPYRDDPTLWFNLPGVVAAYQPIAAPGPLLARYNQAHGGDNRYKATDGTAPTWRGAMGWTFDGATQYLASGVVPSVGWSALGMVSGTSGTAFIVGSFNGGSTRYGSGIATSNAYSYGSGVTASAITVVTGARCLAPPSGYTYGRFDANVTGTWSGTAAQLYIGARNRADITSIDSYLAGQILAVSIYARPLSSSEAWMASRQMAYCHVNPDWSAWGRRRRYYYAQTVTAAAGAVGIYGKRGAVALPGGVRIEAVQ